MSETRPTPITDALYYPSGKQATSCANVGHIEGYEHACRLERDRAELMEALNAARQTHFQCEDCWYSCPKSPEGCCDPHAGDQCNCGADYYNDKIDNVLARLKD